MRRSSPGAQMLRRRAGASAQARARRRRVAAGQVPPWPSVLGSGAACASFPCLEPEFLACASVKKDAALSVSCAALAASVTSERSGCVLASVVGVDPPVFSCFDRPEGHDCGFDPRLLDRHGQVAQARDGDADLAECFTRELRLTPWAPWSA